MKILELSYYDVYQVYDLSIASSSCMWRVGPVEEERNAQESPRLHMQTNKDVENGNQTQAHFQKILGSHARQPQVPQA